MDQQTQYYFTQLRAEFEQRINDVAAKTRGMVTDQLRRAQAQANENLANLARIADALRMSSDSRVEPGTRRIEDIPGDRIPFQAVVDIPIGQDVTAQQQELYTVTQDGPFVATARWMTFQSTFTYQVTDPTTLVAARKTGRSFGRYRPIHSSADVMDGQHNSNSNGADWLSRASDLATAVGVRLPSAVLSLPSNTSSFRTMGFDGRVLVLNEGGRQRSNISVPSSMWSKGIHGPVDQGALDFFERGSVITFQVTPLHVNNPSFGNVDGEAVWGGLTGVAGSSWPFVEGQFDVHEGIASPNNASSPVVSASPSNITAFRGATPITTDSVSRVPEGILTIGFEGYRILQPMGAAR